MQRMILLVAMCVVAFSSAPVSAAPPSELLSGYSLGFARPIINSEKRTVAFTAKNKTVLTLTGEVANKWVAWRRILGQCYAVQPTLTVKNQRGVPASIYRFHGGIIVSWQRGAFVLDALKVMSWEAEGGYKGRLGFPTGDPKVIVPRTPPERI